MTSNIIRTLLIVSIGFMVTLAALGVFVIAQQSEESSIVVPQPEVTKLPSQAPHPRTPKPFIQPGFYNQDSPSPAGR